MDDLEHRLASLRARIDTACAQAGRSPGTCRLLAVSKTRDSAEIHSAAMLGQADFGENYVQEALPKITALAELPAPPGGIHWHLIGPLQANKTRVVAEHFAWVHSLDRERIARRLNDQRPAHLPPLDVCLQINLDGEASKSGVAPADARALATVVVGLPHLRLRGLMTIPRPDQSTAADNAYARLAQTMRELAGTIPGLDSTMFNTLSMGMSDDFELAIAHGATWVRIGTALFGTRPPKPKP